MQNCSECIPKQYRQQGARAVKMMKTIARVGHPYDRWTRDTQEPPSTGRVHVPFVHITKLLFATPAYTDVLSQVNGQISPIDPVHEKIASGTTSSDGGSIQRNLHFSPPRTVFERLRTIKILIQRQSIDLILSMSIDYLNS